MQNYTYHNEVRDILAQFLQAFDGAIIKRYQNDRTARGTVAVRYVYAPKQRTLFDLVDKAQHITLPVVSFWITGMSRDVTRVFNKLEGQYATSLLDSSGDDHRFQPVPINIEVAVSCMTRFQTDMDQIVANFGAYCDPYFIISWFREGMPGIEIRSEVLWSGNLALTYPWEQTDTQPTRMICDTSFTIKGWLFKADSDVVGKIFKIDANFYAVSATPTFENIAYLTDPSTTEMFVISAKPQLSYASRWMTPVSLSGSIDVFGKMLQYTTAVYISGSTGMFSGTTTVNPLLTSSTLSAIYPALTGVVTPLSYYVNTGGQMIIYYQAPAVTGIFDIIVVNDAGYTFLTQSSYNPDYSTQYPYVSGIRVV